MFELEHAFLNFEKECPGPSLGEEAERAWRDGCVEGERSLS